MKELLNEQANFRTRLKAVFTQEEIERNIVSFPVVKTESDLDLFLAETLKEGNITQTVKDFMRKDSLSRETRVSFGIQLINLLNKYSKSKEVTKYMSKNFG